MPAAAEPFHQIRLNGAAPVLLLPQRTGADKKSGKAMHTHPEGQFYFATQGLMVVETAQGRCIMPPGRLGWVPPLLPHGASLIGSARPQAPDLLVGFTLYLEPALCARFPAEPVVLALSDMMRAILARMQGWPQGGPLGEAERRLLDVFIDEVNHAEPEALRLKMPRERRLVTLATAIADEPADETSLDDWAQRLGMSRRSITRHFREETGMTVVEWRQAARLQRALELLADGGSVTSVALTLGYDSISSFIALFRRAMGVTPAKFMAQAAAGGSGRVF
jgi:AraC-like DNA-binding protein